MVAKKCSKNYTKTISYQNLDTYQILILHLAFIILNTGKLKVSKFFGLFSSFVYIEVKKDMSEEEAAKVRIQNEEIRAERDKKAEEVCAKFS